MGYIEPITRRLVGEVTQWDGNRGLAVSGDREFVFERRHIGSIPYVFKVGLRVEIFVDYDETGAQHSFTLNPVPQYGETWFEFCGEEILLSAEQARRLRSRFAAIALRWGLAAAASGLLWLGANSDWSVVSAVILQMATIAAFMRCMDIFWKSRQIYAENSVLAGITEQVLVVSAAAVDWPSKKTVFAGWFIRRESGTTVRRGKHCSLGTASARSAQKKKAVRKSCIWTFCRKVFTSAIMPAQASGGRGGRNA